MVETLTMKNSNTFFKILLVAGFFFITTNAMSQDPNFHIYLCFGQSNMEGQGAIEEQDLTVNERFKVFQAIDCDNLERTKAHWYPAIPPTCQCFSGLSPADYFGRTMTERLPEHITIGVINVAIGGCDIRLFDKYLYQDYDSTYTEAWFTDKIQAYQGNPYAYLMKLAKLAQKDGVIKGILLHQGETNTGDKLWPEYVKQIYDNMMEDLSLVPEEVPLLAGEVLYSDYESCCGPMNTIINTLPDLVSTAHVISAEGCGNMDNAHFSSEGYRTLGKRYAEKMLELIEE